MIQRAELESYLSELLSVSAFRDYCPNGLQVEGRDEIRRLVSGVTASQALIEAAIEAGADALLVHHGYFWKGEDARVVGTKARRIGALLRAGINLLVYHLPLDAHPLYGNNRQLADRLGVAIEGEFDTGMQPSVGLHGRLEPPLSPADFKARIDAALDRESLHVAAGPDPIARVAWCTGAGQGFIDQAADAGVDAFISGEISEPTAHSARERGVHYFGVGHHASERYGVQALGEHLAERFGLDHRYIEIDNPA